MNDTPERGALRCGHCLGEDSDCDVCGGDGSISVTVVEVDDGC